MKTSVFYKQIIASILVIFFILLAWIYTYNIACFSLLIPVLIALVLSSSYIEIKMKEKKCFRNCYFKKNTFIAKILISPVLTSIFFILLSLSYTLSLMYNILTFDKTIFLSIGIFIFLVFGIYNYILRYFVDIINEKHLEIFAREFTIKISALILFCIYLFIYFNSYEPEYLRETLLETVNIATNSISSNCHFIDLILRVRIEIESQVWFLMKGSNNFLEEKNVKTIFWIGFIIVNSLSILALNRFIIQIIYLIKKLIREKDEK